jgi:hypothetical protein
MWFKLESGGLRVQGTHQVKEQQDLHFRAATKHVLERAIIFPNCPSDVAFVCAVLLPVKTALAVEMFACNALNTLSRRHLKAVIAVTLAKQGAIYGSRDWLRNKQ